MSEAIDSIRRHLAEYEKTVDARILEVKLSMAPIIIRGLKKKKISLKTLAQRTGIAVHTLELMLFGDYNWTCSIAGKILHALGMEAELKEREDEKSK